MSVESAFPPISHVSAAVEVLERLGEWLVRVIEDGVEQVTAFVAEAFALAFAEGQRVRLGLQAVTRL